MYVALYHNAKAGLREFTLEEIARLFRDEHHEVDVFSRGEHPTDAAIASDAEVIIAAGGDGTVAAMARALWQHRSNIPLYVLPLGTANNVAWSLGLTDVVPSLVRGLASAREARLDIGLIESGEHKAPFLEAAGSGFLGAALHNEFTARARTLRKANRATALPSSRDARVREAARSIARRIRQAPTLSYEVLADGADLSGDYIAIAAMNIRAIGPRMRLAPDANSADGLLDLVLVRPEARHALATLIELQDEVRAPTIDCRRVQDVELSWPGHGYRDDDPWPPGDALASARHVHLCVGGSVRLLLPTCCLELNRGI